TGCEFSDKDVPVLVTDVPDLPDDNNRNHQVNGIADEIVVHDARLSVAFLRTWLVTKYDPAQKQTQRRRNEEENPMFSYSKSEQEKSNHTRKVEPDIQTVLVDNPIDRACNHLKCACPHGRNQGSNKIVFIKKSRYHKCQWQE